MGSFLPQVVFRWWKSDNSPAFNWTAGFYGAGLDPIAPNLKTVYSDLAQTTPIANPVPFDVEGKATIVLGAGGYKMVIRDDSNVVKFTFDNILGGDGFGSGFGCQFVDTIAALKALDANSSAFCYVAGYYAFEDGGHGMFRWNNTSSVGDDGGYTIIPNSAPTLGRWERIQDEDGCVRAASFGYVNTKSGNLGAQLTAASTYCSVNNRRLTIGFGNVATFGVTGQDFAIYAPEIEFKPGSVLTGISTMGNLLISGRIFGTAEQHFAKISSSLSVFFSAIQSLVNPEWFGASIGASDTVNRAAFTRWFASLSNGGAFTLPPGDWPDTNGGTFLALVPATTPFTLLGRIVGTIGGTIPRGYYGTATDRFRLHEVKFNDGGSIDSVGGGGIQMNGPVTTDQSISAGSSIAATTSMSSGTSITAGTTIVAQQGAGIGWGVIAGQNPGGPGGFTGRPGNSSYQFASAGKILADLNPYTATVSSANLGSQTLKANSLLNFGDRISLKIGGLCAINSARSLIIAVKIGGATLFTGTLTGATQSKWFLDLDLFVSGANFMDGYGRLFSNAAIIPAFDFEQAVAVNLAIDNTILATATVSNVDTCTQYIMELHYEPKP